MDKGEEAGSAGNVDANRGELVTDNLVVFQCESCRSIVGDATNWVAADETLECITLSALTESVRVGDTLLHSSHVHDAGSSFFPLTCLNCNTELGRRYITTPSHLDHLRQHFSLHVSTVTSYQLGSAKVKGVSEGKGQEPPLLLKVVERCMKLQCFVVNLNDRLRSVEKFLQDEEGDPTACHPASDGV